jgi:putative tributyrin esterase
MKRYFLLIVIIIFTGMDLMAQKQHVLRGASLPVADTVWVFTPAAYDSKPDDRFPVVYLLHGWMGSYHQWNDITSCQALSDRFRLILVCPDGLTDSWYINSPVAGGIQYADFFFGELMPYVNKTYRVDTADVFITGLSMGGHGALYLFAQRPELFRSAGSLSGVVDLRFCRDEYGIKERLGTGNGSVDKALAERFSVIGNLTKIATAGKEIIFSCGDSDRFFGLNNQFLKRCNENNINATYIISKGGHDYHYWKTAIGFHLEFFRRLAAQ